MVRIESKSSKLKYKGFPLKMKKQFNGEEKYSLTLNLLVMYFTSCLDSRRKRNACRRRTERCKSLHYDKCEKQCSNLSFFVSHTGMRVSTLHLNFFNACLFESLRHRRTFLLKTFCCKAQQSECQEASNAIY